MPNENQSVTVTDIKMPFTSVFVFMLKCAIASIPVVIVLTLLIAACWTLGISALLSIGSSLKAPHVSSIPSKAAPVSEDSVTQAEKAYISQIVVKNTRVAQDYAGWGGFGEIKNLGSHTLKEVEITIYCLGTDGKPVYEQTYHPVMTSSLAFHGEEAPLKPGYSRHFGVKLDGAPSDWARKVDVKVTSVTFE
jgi:hypothetical protein